MPKFENKIKNVVDKTLNIPSIQYGLGNAARVLGIEYETVNGRFRLTLNILGFQMIIFTKQRKTTIVEVKGNEITTFETAKKQKITE